MTVKCPRCGQDLQPGPEGMVHCPCGFYGFAGYVQEYDYLNARLAWVRDRLAEGAGPPDPAMARAYGVWTAPTPKKSASAQVVLVAVGAVLLILAALVFVAVAWDTIGPWGQIGSLLGITALIALAAVMLRQRAHGAAEALATVSFVLGLICVTAAPALGAVPQSWGSAERPYRLIVYALAMVAGVLLGRRFGLRAWSWLGWLLSPLVLGVALVLTLHGLGNDQLIATVCGMAYLAVMSMLLGRAHDPDQWPMRAAAMICLLVALGLLIGTATFEPPAGAVLLTAAGLLITVWLRLDWAGWPLLGFGVALLAMFLPDATATTAAVGAAGVALMFSLHHRGPPLAVLSGFTLWTAYFVGATPESLKLLALIAGIGLFGFSLLAGAAPVAWLGAGLVWLAFLFYVPDTPFLEAPTLVLAVLLLAAGLISRRAGIRNSGLVYGPALTVALIPSAVLCWWRVWELPSLIRFGLVMVAGVTLLVIGVRRHLVGLVVPATIAVSIAATAQVFATLNLLPRWLALAVAGAILIAIGARLEWVRERGKDTEEWLQTLR